jgi:hypothetical protein
MSDLRYLRKCRSLFRQNISAFIQHSHITWLCAEGVLSLVRTACYNFMIFFSSCQIIVESIEDGDSTFSRHIRTCLHDVISQNAGIHTSTAMRTSNLASKTNFEENYKT